MTNNRWDENLLNPTNYQNPTRWKTEEKLCTCKNAATDFDVEPVCSVNEEDTCTREKPRKGRKQNVETRHKRDASFINLDIERRLDRLRNFIFEQHAHATPRKKVFRRTLKYSRLLLSRNRRDPLKHFEISALRHIRFVILRKKQLEQPNFTIDYVI